MPENGPFPASSAPVGNPLEPAPPATAELQPCDHMVISTFDPLPGWSDKPVDEWDWDAMCFTCKASGVAYHDRGFVPNGT